MTFPVLSLPPGTCPGGGTVGLGVRKEVVDGRPAPAMTFPVMTFPVMTFPVLNLPPGACPGGGVAGGPEAAAAAASPSPSALRASTLVRSSRPKAASAGEVSKAVWPASGGLRARLLGGSSLDHNPVAVMVRGGMPALIAAVAAGGDVWAAFAKLCQ